MPGGSWATFFSAGERSSAEWEREQIQALSPGFSLERWLQTYPLTSAPHREALARLLAPVGL